MFCLFLVCMDLSFTFNLPNLKTPLIRQSHRLSNKREFSVFCSPRWLTPVSIQVNPNVIFLLFFTYHWFERKFVKNIFCSLVPYLLACIIHLSLKKVDEIIFISNTIYLLHHACFTCSIQQYTLLYTLAHFSSLAVKYEQNESLTIHGTVRADGRAALIKQPSDTIDLFPYIDEHRRILFRNFALGGQKQIPFLKVQ